MGASQVVLLKDLDSGYAKVGNTIISNLDPYNKLMFQDVFKTLLLVSCLTLELPRYILIGC